MLAWSYILDYENSVNPHEFRKVVIDSWKKRSFIHVTENRRVLTLAKQILKLNLKAKDSLHIACAIEANCDYFITTDDKITSKKALIDQARVLNPVELIHIIEEK